MEFCNLFYNGQTQAGAVASGAGLVSCHKGFKESLSDVRGNAASAVSKKQLERLLEQYKKHAPPRRRLPNQDKLLKEMENMLKQI